MGIIEKFFKTRQQSKAAKKEHDLQKSANELFQIEEYDGLLWVTYMGNKVCPCEMLIDEPIPAIKKMREMYVSRVKTESNEERRISFGAQ